MKRFLCIFLSFVMMLSACLIVFAENTTVITDEYESGEYCSDYEYDYEYDLESEEYSEAEKDMAVTTSEPTTVQPESTTKGAGVPQIDSNPTTNWGVIDSVGEWKAFQHLSITFFISVNSIATVSYHAVAKNDSKLEATVYLEKLVLGKWERVSVGTNGNKFTNRASGLYISGTQTVKINGNGMYRAVVSVRNGYGSAIGSVKSEFDVNTSLADVNLDGKVTAMDARLALRFSAGLQRYALDQKSRGDINGDGKLTAADARIILRIAAKLM